MKLDINPRGNGACPLCDATADCRLKKLLAGSVASVNGADNPDMEIVVYSCGYFREKA